MSKEADKKNKKETFKHKVISDFEVRVDGDKPNKFYNPGDVYETDSKEVVQYLQNKKYIE